MNQLVREDNAWLGAPISFELNGTSYYYVKNIQGDIMAIVDDSGAKVVEYTYNSWGKVISTTGSLADTVGVKNPYRYRGYRYDNETGFYYLQSRYYDPEIGRFINADDIDYLGASGTTLSYNLFAYCENDPVNGVDPSGYLTLKADRVGLAIDIALTLISTVAKYAYDIIGMGLKAYARKKGFKLFFEKFMGTVPKIKGF